MRSIEFAVRTLTVVATVCLAGASLANAAPPSQMVPLTWHDAYRTALKVAVQQKKMLLIDFVAQPEGPTRTDVQQRIAEDLELRKRLSDFVLVRVPVDTSISIDGQQTRLLDHAAFGEMHGHEGLAVIDFAHPDQPYYHHVVSAFPFMRGKYYTFHASSLPVIVDLPPGTITQRTMIWAVRVHPEKPRSTAGQESPILVGAASRHSAYQARIGLQGHHRWESRFQLLRRLLGGRRMPVEVVAESWPGQNMIDSCIDCVASWRQSSGHWNAVQSAQAMYGYDIHLGNNGIWYGTGIFAN